MNRKVNGTVSHSSQLILWMAVEICEEFRGRSSIELSGTSTATEAAHRGAAGAWRNAFIAGGHRHDAFVRLGLVMETFETAITWDRFAAFHAAVMEATEAAAQRVCGRGMVSCRFSYVYPDGPAPYYTVLGQGRPGSELEQWAEIKAAASDALIAAGGTITHHHAVGRYHRPWYDQERPPLFAEAYGAVRRALDPAGIMNPGVLIDLLPSWMARAMSSLDGRDEHFIASIVFQTAGQCWRAVGARQMPNAAHLTKFL